MYGIIALTNAAFLQCIYPRTVHDGEQRSNIIFMLLMANDKQDVTKNDPTTKL